jgi:hypothetical protein
MNMARETKEQKMERMAAERAAEQAVARATYLSRLMMVLERATKANFELEVKDGLFVLEDRDARRDGTYRLPAEWHENADDYLQTLEFEVSYKEEAQREAERKARVRAAALSKLSAEEKDLLGL